MLEAVFDTVYRSQAVALSVAKDTALVGTVMEIERGKQRQHAGSGKPVYPIVVRMTAQASVRILHKERDVKAAIPFIARNFSVLS